MINTFITTDHDGNMIQINHNQVDDAAWEVISENGVCVYCKHGRSSHEPNFGVENNILCLAEYGCWECHKWELAPGHFVPNVCVLFKRPVELTFDKYEVLEGY